MKREFKKNVCRILIAMHTDEAMDFQKGIQTCLYYMRSQKHEGENENKISQVRKQR